MKLNRFENFATTGIDVNICLGINPMLYSHCVQSEMRSAYNVNTIDQIFMWI